MKIKELQYKKINIDMKKPFKIALGSTDFYEGYFVKVVSDSGLEGYGEAIPTPFITGDTMGSVEAELSIFRQALKGSELSTEAVNERMKALARSSKASRAAVDMALYDILGKKADLPLYQILGGYRSSMKTSYTVDLVGAPEARIQAKELLDDGVLFFKIKLGKSTDEDFERVKAVREVIGDDKMICVDFNQSYLTKE
ncbi:mandelate racemase/muconate lactonizing enzyme family protein, partial [mine drainage metagenome]